MKQLIKLITTVTFMCGFYGISNAQSCELQCKPLFDINIEDNNEAQVILDDLVSSDCNVEINFSITSLDGEVVFSTTDPETGWTVTEDHVGSKFIYKLENEETENTCQGKIIVHSEDQDVAINENCDPDCLGGIALEYFDEEIKVFIGDVLLSPCSAEFEFTITDDSGATVHNTTDRQEPWTVQQIHAGRTFDFVIERTENGSTCAGQIQISQFVATDCSEQPVDLSQFEIPATMDFTGESQGQVLYSLAQQYDNALEDLLISQGVSGVSRNYEWTYEEDAVFEGGALNLQRNITVLDWCTQNTITRSQFVSIVNPMTLAVLDILFGQTNKPVSISSILLENEINQSTTLQIDGSQNLGAAVKATIESQAWENKNVSLKIVKEEDCKVGLSVTDMVQIVNHVLGNKKLKDNSSFLAADFNSDGSVTATDLVGMLNVMLDKTACGPQNNWRFFKNDINQADLSMLSSPSALEPYELRYEVKDDVDTPINITAIKKGDVNHSALDKKALNRSFSSELMITDIDIKAGQTYEIPINLTDATTIVAGDVSIGQNRNLEVIGFKSEYADISQSDYRTDENEAHLLIYKMAQVNVPSDEALFSIVIKSQVNGKLSEILSTDDLSIDLYSSVEAGAGELYNVRFSENENQSSSIEAGYTVYNNGVNVLIESNQESAAIQSVAMYNMAGQELYTQQNINAYNVTLPKNQMEGIVAYRVINENGVVHTGKLFL